MTLNILLAIQSRCIRVPDPAHLHEALSVFREAVNWKAYWSKAIAPYVGTRVLEAGAGVGANTALFLNSQPDRKWFCMEPDLELVEHLKRSRDSQGKPNLIASTVEAFSKTAKFDSIMYIDVLEHIKDDEGELRRASELLAPGGRLIVLSPAYAFLYSEFDRAIGHYRRYSSGALNELTPEGMRLVRMRHLDSVGLVLSLANRMLLRQGQPTRGQIIFWDRVIIPLSKVIDPLIGCKAGRSIIAVWERVA